MTDAERSSESQSGHGEGRADSDTENSDSGAVRTERDALTAGREAAAREAAAAVASITTTGKTIVPTGDSVTGEIAIDTGRHPRIDASVDDGATDIYPTVTSDDFPSLTAIAAVRAPAASLAAPTVNMAAVHDDAITADTPLPPETRGIRDEAPTTSTPLPPIEQPPEGFALSQVLRACRLRQTPLPPAVACYIVREVALARSQSALGAVDTAQIALGASGEVTVLESAGGVSGDERNALGRLLYECLVLRRVSGEEVTPPAQLIDSIPTAVDELVMRLLTEDGEDDDAALAAELEPLCAQLGGDSEAVRQLLVDLESALPQRAIAPEEVEIGHAETLIAKRATVSGASGAKVARPAAGLEAMVWRWRWAITGAAALLAFVMPALLGSRRAAPVVPAAVMAVPAPAPALSVPALVGGDLVPASVRLRVGGPDGALVTVDDEPIGVLPLDVTLPGRAGTRRMAVTQPRHRPWLRTIPGNMDVAVVVELPANGPAAAPAPAAAAPTAPRRPVVVKSPYSK